MRELAIADCIRPESPHPVRRVVPPHADAAAITRAASTQTYATIRLLADRDRAADAFRAYAYYRWVDDQLDEGAASASDRAAFLARQQMLLTALDTSEVCRTPLRCAEEQFLADLLAGDDDPASGLRSYLGNMMAVMAFDVARRGRLITAAELDDHTTILATAVSDALFHFIGHDDQPPRTAERSLAVRGACVVHMLRDAVEDYALGYVNVPAEYLAAHGLAANDFHAPAYRAWVCERVTLARDYLRDGRAYLATLRNPRCRLAGRAYIARFEYVARAIERDGYRLRLAYPERKSPAAALWMVARALGARG